MRALAYNTTRSGFLLHALAYLQHIQRTHTHTQYARIRLFATELFMCGAFEYSGVELRRLDAIARNNSIERGCGAGGARDGNRR